MIPLLLEWLHALLRVAHVLAAILWVGDSFLFVWMDSHLSKPDGKPREGDVVGELWMTHSGGFYEVVKRRSLAALPKQLYWFKWESYSTFLTGFVLFSVVYWVAGPGVLTEVGAPLSQPLAVALSFGLLVAGVALYHLACATPLIRAPVLLGIVGLAAIVGLAYALQGLFTPRAIFLQLGAMVGTIMSSNVLFRIIPAQREMLAATREGRPVDTSFGARAKERSTHNHYLTFPVLFVMLSNHLPAFYGHAQAPLVLGLVAIFLVGVKHAMNQRAKTPPVILALTVVALLAVIALTRPAARSLAGLPGADGPKVSFATVRQIVDARCVTCHAAAPVNPSFLAPPAGVILETDAQLEALAPRILVRAVQTRTMPLGNLTGMTDEERGWLGAWIAQGADLHAEGASLLAAAPIAAPPPPPAEPAALFVLRCAPCHGEGGRGDGPAAVALTPKPRDLTDPAFHAAKDDAALRRVILEGGGAVGLSAVMPPNPDLAAQPALLDGLVVHLRKFRNEGAAR